MSKLKFNFLELQTKRLLLEHISDEQEWLRIAEEWAPGPLKALEMKCHSRKEALKAIKEAQCDLKASICAVCEQLVVRISAANRKRAEAIGLAQSIRSLLDTLSAKPSIDLAANETWSIPELKNRIQAAKVDIEKKTAALNVQRQAVSDLNRLLSHQSDQSERTRGAADALEEEMGAARKSPQASGALADLCRWYRSVTELTEEMTGVHCEAVRPDYLHVTVTNPATAASVPIHLNIDAVTGRLLSVSIGSTANTPKMQWKELIDVAVKTNDIPLLIRQVHYKIIR